MRAVLLALAMLASAAAVDAPGVVADGADNAYAAWQRGEPAAAVEPLLALARERDGWASWLDAGLAAAAAGDRGRAVAALLAARRRAPERREAREALQALDVAPPPGWLERLGPLAEPGIGWAAVILAGFAGLLLGAGLAAPRRRRGLLAIGAGAALALAPGQAAWWHDAREPLAAIVSDTRLLDSSGAAGAPIAAGTVVRREPRAAWAGRRLVATPAGAKGYVAEADLAAW